MEDYRELNRALWDERAPAHAASPDYQLQQFREDPTHLSEVVQFDVPRLGDLRGMRGVHLQCHIGTDTISLCRLGASMVGLDFSAPAVAEGTRLAADTGADATFVEGEVYDAVGLLGAGAFDLVFTGIGALCWLPDIDRWAGVVAGLLRPGGRLFIREGHPELWSIDERRTDALVIDYPYFQRDEGTVFESEGTYVATATPLPSRRTIEWNHGLGEVVTAVLDHGMALTALVEHDSVPWEALPGQMEEIGGGEWRLRDRPWRLPHTYTLQAVKTVS